MSDTPTEQQAIFAAIDVRRLAHAPYSGFPVGAALVDREGGIHSGCNVENASYGLTTCAERVAVFKAVSAGRSSFSTLIIVSSGAKPPCGACRQVISEFASDDLRVLLVDADQPDKVIETSLGDLFPARFSL